jgi:pyruvate,water dikinase
MKYVKWFKDISKEDVGIAGGKGANLGEMTQAKIPVPPGFVVLASAYFAFLDHNGLRPEIHKILKTCDMTDPNQLNSAAKKIDTLLEKSPMPEEVTREIFSCYHELNRMRGLFAKDTPVAVRSSATAEDLPEASFAGQQESYLNVVGDTNVLQKVKECYISLFGARSIFYREQQHFDHFKVGIAVPVQTMVQSEVSGVMFTVDPISQDKNKLVIEAVYGLGDYIVQGVVTPDHYEIDKNEVKILSKHMSRQEVMEIRKPQGVKEVSVPKHIQQRQKLHDKYILELARIGKHIHHHYFFPQDIEWSYAGKKLYIVQSRPITTLGKEHESSAEANTSLVPTTIPPILTGAPASPGVVSGPVRIVSDIKKLGAVKAGDILVTDMTTPDFVPAMKRAAGIVTNRGGLTSHAAIVSRELGVPCVVGTTTATKVLKEGMIVTVDGHAGQVYKGAIAAKSVKLNSPEAEPIKDYKTATKVYVNLAEPELAAKIAKNHVDGVGLLRAEFMIAGIGTHPKKLIEDHHEKIFIEKLSSEISQFCKAFEPRPVIYRATDFKTNEYRSLKGGEKYEPEESNPMLGFRGAYRYIKTPEVFNLELEAIKKVRSKHKNLHLMIPFVSSVSELVEVKKLVAASGLYRSSNFKLFMMVEIPANVILLDDFIDVGIDGVSIGSNDLTMLILGIDRDNSEVAPQFNERNPAVLWALERTIKTCLRRGILCGICGQAPSEYPELVEKLVNWGITSISVNPDAIARTREIVYHSEARLITHHSTAHAKTR